MRWTQTHTQALIHTSMKKNSTVDARFPAVAYLCDEHKCTGPHPYISEEKLYNACVLSSQRVPMLNEHKRTRRPTPIHSWGKTRQQTRDFPQWHSTQVWVWWHLDCQFSPRAIPAVGTSRCCQPAQHSVWGGGPLQRAYSVFAFAFSDWYFPVQNWKIPIKRARRNQLRFLLWKTIPKILANFFTTGFSWYENELFLIGVEKRRFSLVKTSTLKKMENAIGQSKCKPL